MGITQDLSRLPRVAVAFSSNAYRVNRVQLQSSFAPVSDSGLVAIHSIPAVKL